MKYSDFKRRVIRLPIVSAKDMLFSERKKQAVRNQLSRWQTSGLVIKLKRGIYMLNENDRKVSPSRQYIANQLYTPSYVSLEFALGFYGLIPERVTDVTSVTTKKTTRFKNPLGAFVYQRIMPNAFSGFRSVKDEAGLSYFLALPEKAVVDFLYFNVRKGRQIGREELIESYRFQNVETLNRKMVLQMAALFNNKRLAIAARSFCECIKREKKS